MDLFEPGLGSQVHDYNGGIPPSGLFWTVQLRDDAFRMSEDGRQAFLHVRDLPVLGSDATGSLDTPQDVTPLALAHQALILDAQAGAAQRAVRVVGVKVAILSLKDRPECSTRAVALNR